jgi:transcription elongation factor SPT6
MLKAEEEGLINIVIEIGDEEKKSFLDALSRCVHTNEYGEVATAWNELRKDICVDLIDNHLIPAAARWTREVLKGQAEDFVADGSRQELEYVCGFLLYLCNGC